MAMKEGECHLCGVVGPLSFEHVPPRAAFNKHPVLVATGEDLLRAQMDPSKARRQIQQGGFGGHTLCQRCNSVTGRWYGEAFVDWTFQAMQILALADGAPSLYYTYSLHPVRVLKQVLCMFMSANAPGFRKAHPELERFILGQQVTHLDPRYQVAVYFNVGAIARQHGIAGIGDMERGRFWMVSEIGSVPLGYLLAVDTGLPDKRALNISFFAEFDYDTRRQLSLRIPCLPVFSPYPADFRTQSEIDETVRMNRGRGPEPRL